MQGTDTTAGIARRLSNKHANTAIVQCLQTHFSIKTIKIFVYKCLGEYKELGINTNLTKRFKERLII